MPTSSKAKEFCSRKVDENELVWRLAKLEKALFKAIADELTGMLTPVAKLREEPLTAMISRALLN